MRKWILLTAVAMTFANAAPVMAADETPLTLERVFASPSLNGPSPRMVKLSPDGALLTSLRPRADDRERYDLWAMDTKTGAWRMLVDSLKFGSDGAISEEEKMQRERARIGGTKGIVSYDWAADGKSILVPLDGDLFLADLNGTVTRLTNTEAGELNAAVSPRGGYVSFVRDQNVVVLDRSSGKEKQVTSTGKGTLSWGVAEFVAQEEMDRSEGLWWSPDDQMIAVARVDEAGVNVVSRAAIGAEGTSVFDQRYPAAGTPNAEVSLYVMRADGSKPVVVDLGPDADIYLARVNWTPDSKSLFVQRQSRDQKALDMLVVDPVTGKSRLLFRETAKSWINLHSNLKFLRDGSLLWTSERDGYSHIYRFQKGKWTQLTKGEWMVSSIVGVNEKSAMIYFTANKGAVTERNLFTTPIGGGPITQLSEPGYFYTVNMDKTASSSILSRSGPNQPDQVYLGDGNGNRVAWIEENALNAAHPYAPYLSSHVPTQFGSITAADGSVLSTKLLTPKIEAGKTYPVFVQVYNGPGAGRQVTATWGGALHQYLVAQGWIIFSVDGRGSPDRGTAFEDQIYRSMGGVEVADQLAGVAWLKKQSFVDPKKIAVYGWSYGGYMTLKLLEAAPGIFAAGVSGAPVTKWELYDTHYTERYMGTPRDDAAAYAKSDAIVDAHKIADPLLLIHGMADDNVVFEHSTALMAKMQSSATPFETMVYPGQTHRVGGPKISVHLWKTILAFLDRNVKNKE